MEALRIGHSAQQYPEKRNIIGKVANAEYKLCHDYYGSVGRLNELIGIREPTEWLADRPFRFRDFGLNSVDCLHLFNAINYSHTPWVCTFETFLPRFLEVLTYHSSCPQRVQSSRKVSRALDHLAADSCVALIALSNSAFEIQGRFLELFPEFRQEILKKTLVLHPPQSSAVPRPELLDYPYECGDSVGFILVGHDFFRKGGAEVLRAFERVRSRSGRSIELCVVSALHADRYASETDSSDESWARQFIKDHSDWIEYHPGLSHDRVIEKMSKCDVGLLPSYAETYGYSVLELQSQGRPVITTDVRAFPEINSNECGWILPVPKREVGGEAYFRTSEERKRLSEAIEMGLAVILEEIMENPSQIRDKGEKALQRVLNHHDPENFGKKLETVYRKAL